MINGLFTFTGVPKPAPILTINSERFGINPKTCGGGVKNIALYFIQFYIYAISYCIITQIISARFYTKEF